MICSHYVGAVYCVTQATPDRVLCSVRFWVRGCALADFRLEGNGGRRDAPRPVFDGVAIPALRKGRVQVSRQQVQYNPGGTSKYTPELIYTFMCISFFEVVGLDISKFMLF